MTFPEEPGDALDVEPAPAGSTGQGGGTVDEEVQPGGIPEPLVEGSAGPEPAPSVEAEQPGPDDVTMLSRQRDDYLDALRRLQADFENYKKRIAKQQSEYTERAGEALVTKLLPVLDTADLALAHGGGEEIKQLSVALTDTLQREGLERIDPQGAPFDPTMHDAVAHEPAEGDDHAQVVTEVLRAGYRWRSRVLRPAMVKVRG